MLGLTLKFIFLLLILFGLAQFFSYRLKMKSEFLPVTVLTGIGIMMFIAGLLNIMPETVKLLTAFSLGSLVYVFWKKKSFENIFSNGMIFFLLGSVYLAFFLSNMPLEYYDDFSHWGLIVKEMLWTDRLPNFSSNTILFQSYPPGTAVLLYFIGKILGDTEGIMLFGQGMLYLSCITPMFALLRKRKFLGWLLVVPVTLYFLTGNLGIVALSVDTALSLLGIAGTAILIYFYREKCLVDAILPLMLITTYVNVVKNSGIMFVVILVGLYFALILKERVVKSSTAIGGMVIMVTPLLFKFLWDKHVKLVFADGSSTKHAMSVENYKNVFGEKPTESVFQITKDLLWSSVNIQSTEIKIFVIILVTVGLILILKKMNVVAGIKEAVVLPRRKECGLLFFMIGIYIAYQLGLWATYVFSMPLAEAVVLASYNRYNTTIIMYLLGVALIYFLVELDQMEQKPVALKAATVGISFVLVLVPVFLANEVVQNLFVKKDYTGSYKTHLHSIVQENQLTGESAYILYVGDYVGTGYSQDYLYYLSSYELQTRNVSVMHAETINDLGELTGPFKFIVLRDDPKVSNKLKQYGIIDYEPDTVILLNEGGK